jgi:dihydrolipoamide dehydrogenase
MTQQEKVDVAVIGAGPGGYVAAIKAAQLGKTVALIERKQLGGTCLNVGCIPTKTLLSGAHVMQEVMHAAEYGIQTGPVSIDFPKMKARKERVIENLRKSLEGLLRSNGIRIVRGSAEFLSPREIKVRGEDNVVLYAEKTIIATGSEPLDIPAFPCDHKRVFNSTSILDMTELPQSLAIIGGGYIGCEFASLYAELGVEVTILEMLPSIVQLQGKSVSAALTRAFASRGVDVQTGVVVEGIDSVPDGVSVRLKDRPAQTFTCALVAVGRKVVSEELHVERAGVLTDAKGAIPVNEKMETGVPGVYAIGDVTGKLLLAHVASHQGVIAASNACGREAVMHYNAVPAVIFTLPEIACVGMTLEQAQEAGFAATASTFPFQALGKSIAAGDTEGFAQLVSDKKTGQILGAQVVGHEASTLIAEATLAIANELTLDCLADTVHAHPTIAEAWLEAALIAKETPLHFPPKVKHGKPA